MEKFKKKFKAYHIYRLIHDTLHYSPKQCAIGNSVDVKKYVSSVTSFDFVVASPNTFSNVQGFRFKDDSVSNEIISDI